VNTYDHNPVRCPHCRATTTSAATLPTSGHTEAPGDGDISVCAYCATPSLYETAPGGALRLRPPTPTERAELAGEMGRAQQAMMAWREGRTEQRATL
jgi:hypothetical protein